MLKHCGVKTAADFDMEADFDDLMKVLDEKVYPLLKAMRDDTNWHLNYACEEFPEGALSH